MLSNQKSSRFYSVKGLLFTAIALALLMSVTAFASGNSRLAFIDSAKEFFGLQSTSTAPVAAPAIDTSSIKVKLNNSAFTDIAVGIPTVNAASGLVIVPVNIGDTTGLNIVSYDMQITFDHLVITPDASPATNGPVGQSAPPGGLLLTPNSAFTDHLIISAFSGSPVSGAGVLVNLRFNIVGAAGTSSALTFEDYTDPTTAFHAGMMFNEGDPVGNPITNGAINVPAATSTNTNTPTPSATSTSTATFTPTPVTNTPTGTNVSPSGPGVPSDATVTFSSVTTAGNTSYGPVSTTPGTFSPGVSLCPTCPRYDITTTAVYTPPVTVCLNVPASVPNSTFQLMQLLHEEGGVMVDRTIPGPGGHPTSPTRQVCGSVNSLSPFVIGQTVAPCLNVDIADVIGSNGSPVDVPISVAETLSASDGVFSADTHVTFDPSVLTVPAAAPYGVTLIGPAAGRTLTISHLTANTLEISIHGTAAWTGTGNFVNLHFNNVTGGPGTVTPVSFSPFLNTPDGFKFNEDDPCSDPTDGSVSILGGHVDGRVTYGNTPTAPQPRGVENVTITATADSLSSPTGMTATTNGLGFYQFNNVFGPGGYTFTPTKPQAAPLDSVGGSLSSFDAAKIARKVVDLETFSAPQTIVADTTGDGTITSFDATQIARHVVGLSSMLTGSWIFDPTSIYHPFFTSVSGDNYTALLMGEVTGNYLTDSTSLPGGRSASTGGPERGIAVTVPQITTPANGVAVIPVNVSGTTNKGIISYQFDVRYDASVIRPQADPVVFAGTLSSGFVVITNAQEAGLLRVAIFGTMPLNGNGVLMNLRFNAIGNPFATSPISLERFMFNEGRTRAQVVDGRVELSPAVPNTAAAE